MNVEVLCIEGQTLEKLAVAAEEAAARWKEKNPERELVSFSIGIAVPWRALVTILYREAE